MEEESDQALMAEVARGDPAALRSLYLRYGTRTFNLILRMAGDRETARDLVQETFMRVWTMAGTFRGDRGASFKSWLFTIALNLTRDERSRKRHKARHVGTDEAGELASPAPGPEAALAHSEAGRRVRAALGQLPPYLREVVVLKVYQQLKFREIAEITGAPEGTLKARFHRAVAELRAQLGAADGGRA
jgi:RNA polymerase sigma-70 factor (ECF subfamily)